jgi:hypothetical protein
MERGWLDTVQLLGLDIALLVIIVVAALSAITARLALDPAELVGRWLLARIGTRRPSPKSQQADELLTDDAEPVSARSAAPDSQEVSPTAEWLDRLLTRDPERQPGPSGSRQDEHGPQPGRRVA